MRDEAMRLTVKDRNNKMNCKDMVLTSRYQQFSLPASILDTKYTCIYARDWGFLDIAHNYTDFDNT